MAAVIDVGRLRVTMEALPGRDQRARDRRFRAVVGMFLDGVADRRDDAAPFERYAHVYKSSLSVCVTDDAAYKWDVPEGWDWLGTIDLDSGELVGASGLTALGRSSGVR